MQEVGFSALLSLGDQTDRTAPLLWPGLEVVSPEPSAGARTSGQWGPLREGPVEGQGARELLPELVLKTERKGKIAWPILPPAHPPGSSATDSLWPHLLRSWLSGNRKMPFSVIASRAGGRSENGSENQQADD